MGLNEQVETQSIPVDILIRANDLVETAEEDCFAGNTAIERLSLQLGNARTDYDRCAVDYAEVQAALRHATRVEDAEGREKYAAQLLERMEDRMANIERVRELITQLEKLMHHHMSKLEAMENADAATG